MSAPQISAKGAAAPPQGSEPCRGTRFAPAVNGAIDQSTVCVSKCRILSTGREPCVMHPPTLERDQGVGV